MKFPRALFKKNRDTKEERRTKKEEGRSETYQRSRTTLELSCTVMYGSKRERERGNVSTHKFSKVQNAEVFKNVFLSKKTTTTYHFPHGIVLQRKQNETIVSAVVEERFWELLFFRWHFCCLCVY